MKDSLGDRMKEYELAETARRFMPLLPIYARIDGRSFSKFTRGMARPFDVSMSLCMQETVKYLVQETHATVGYTQSDEISLVWKNDKIESQPMFDGKVFKLTSILAALATAKFNEQAAKWFPAKMAARLPVFDARVFQLPNLYEAGNAILWRVNDAVKNSVSMAASAYYSHGVLMGKNSADKHELLFQKGVNWNDYPVFFKEGSFFKRVTEWKLLDSDTVSPFVTEIERERLLSTGVLRTSVKEMDWSPFKSITNKIDVLFNNEDPIRNVEAIHARG